MRAWVSGNSRIGLVKPLAGLVGLSNVPGSPRTCIWLPDHRVDVGGYNPPWTYNGTVTRVPGRFGGAALQFDGTTGYLVIPIAPANILEGGNGHSMTAWAWVFRNATNGIGPIFAKGNDSINVGWNLSFGKQADTSVMCFGRLGSTNGFATWAIPSQGVWHHVAVTWNGSDITSTGAKFYLNGALKTQTAAGDLGTQNAFDIFDLHIGHHQGQGQVGPTQTFFDGIIDHFGFDRRVYTAPEIARLYLDPFWFLNSQESNIPALSVAAGISIPVLDRQYRARRS